MLTIQNVTLTSRHHQILNHINLSFHDNHVYGIVGPNGVGKTTLFKSILGITRYSGQILINGKQPNDLQIGKLIEYPTFYQKLTVTQNLQLFAAYMAVDPKVIPRILSQVGLVKVKNTRFQDLSLGTKQRLGIARALMGNNRILLLDEPQNGLDPLGIKGIRNLLNEPALRKDKIILLASHNLNEITQIVDDLIFVDKGQVLCQIHNQQSPYFLFQTRVKNAYLTTIDANDHLAPIKDTSFILTTYLPAELHSHYPQIAADYVGHIDNLEAVFDFVITKEVKGNVNFD